jgi:hypothetical protein
VDETYLKVGGTWRYLFRAIDQFGQVIDAFLSPRRNREAARRFFAQAISRTRVSPTEVTTDRYRVYPRVLDELLPAAFHDTEAHANNPLETDHGRLKARLRPMRGLKRDRTTRVIVARARLRPEPPPRLLRLRNRCPTDSSSRRRVRRSGPRHLIPAGTDRFATPVLQPTQQYCFQLSVAATAGMVALATPLAGNLRFLPRPVALAAGTSLAARMGVTPILLFHFHEE